MCGIAGVVTDDGPVQPHVVERMCATMEHRGPDSRGLFADENAALGVQRLAVIDVEGGDQPISNEDGSVVVVCNGEIYNYLELREQLSRRGHRFATRSDTEVIAHLYEELGSSCVQSLRGMFAFAVWDRRERRMMLARDRVGKKPLFYALRGGYLWFASEPRALLASGEVPRDINYAAIDLFLHYQCVPGHTSAFEALRKLPPAHTLTWSAGHIDIRRYWKLSYRGRPAPVDNDDACREIREKLLEATRLRLRSDVEVGAMLSGGLDSSSVVAAMARLGVRPLRTFSIGFDVEGFDESEPAREVAALYGAQHQELKLDASALAMLPRLVWHYGEPFADSSALATFAVADLAAREVTVVLNGDGGDENFAGYRRYQRFADHHGDVPERPYETFGAAFAHSYFDQLAREDLYEPDFLPALREVQEGWLTVLSEPYRASDADNALERLLDVDVQTYLPNDLLVKMDTATMAHSLEVRSPLLDQSMMELAASLPPRMKLYRGEHKSIFKQAMREWLPDRIIDRPKMGFMVPLAEWFRSSAPQLAGDVLLDPHTIERGMFRETRLRSLIAEHSGGCRDHAYRLWTLIELELWLRTYIDRNPAEGPLAMAVA